MYLKQVHITGELTKSQCWQNTAQRQLKRNYRKYALVLSESAIATPEKYSESCISIHLADLKRSTCRNKERKVKEKRANNLERKGIKICNTVSPLQKHAIVEKESWKSRQRQKYF